MPPQLGEMNIIKEIAIGISAAAGIIAAMGAAFSLVLCFILANSGELSIVTIRQILNII